MFLKTTTALAGAALVTLGAAGAQTLAQGEEATGPYGGIGYSFINVSETDFDLDENSNAIQLRAGYQFHPNFGIEADGAFGIDDGGFDIAENEDDIDIDIDGDDAINRILEGEGEFGVQALAGVYLKFTVPVADMVDFYLRSGYSYINVNRSISLNSAVDPADGEDDFFDFNDNDELSFDGSAHGYGFGGGLGYDITEAFTARADYMYHRFRGSDDIQAHQGQIALQYKFPISF